MCLADQSGFWVCGSTLIFPCFRQLGNFRYVRLLLTHDASVLVVNVFCWFDYSNLGASPSSIYTNYNVWKTVILDSNRDQVHRVYIKRNSIPCAKSVIIRFM